MDSSFQELILLDLDKFLDSYASYGYESKDAMVNAALIELRHSMREDASRQFEDNDNGQSQI